MNQEILNIEGRNLNGIHFATDFLIQSNRRIEGKILPEENAITAQGKNVVIIGGGDTGADCVGTANRQGAECITQIEIMPRPPEWRTDAYPWPMYPLILKTSTSHEEGGKRDWSILTKKFTDEKGRVSKLICSRVEFSEKDAKGAPIMKEIKGSEFEINADLVILALGFLHPEHKNMLTDLNLEFDERGNVKTNTAFQTNVDKVFAAGDLRRGQSLIVWAINEGRRAAYNVDKYLMGKSNLPDM